MEEHKELLGQRFGRQTVVAVGLRAYKLPACACTCDCGSTRIVAIRALREGKSRGCRSCGLGKLHFTPGQMFGLWTVVSQSENGKGGRTRWLCRCACGYEKVLFGKKLNGGETTGCKSCLNRVHPNTAVAANQKYAAYVKAAEKRNLSFELTREEFECLILQNCHYCGQEPNQRKKQAHNGVPFYNGVDRVDNDLGYMTNNCVPCCRLCNRIKMDLSREGFFAQIRKIIAYQRERDPFSEALEWVEFSLTELQSPLLLDCGPR